jgi:hypothetical protein
MEYNNGDSFEGEWTRNIEGPTGTYIIFNGDKYEGEIQGKHRVGRGNSLIRP